MKKFVVSLLSAILLPLHALAQPLQISALLDLSRIYAPQGQAFQRGIELAAGELNQLTPGSVLVHFEDTQYQNTATAAAAQRLISLKKVSVFLTMTASEHKVVTSIAKKVATPAVALWDSSPEIESYGEYSFGFGPWTPGTGEVSARFAYVNMGLRKAFVVTQLDEWSEGVGNYFKESFEKFGGQVIGFDRLDPESADFRSVVAKIRKSPSDAVFFPIPRNISQFLRQGRQQKLTQTLITADVLSEEEIAVSQGAAEGAYHIEADAPESPKAQKLYERYREQYGNDCQLKPFLSWGYDATLVLADAWKRANKQPGKPFADAIRQTKNLETSSGTVSVSAKGSLPKNPSPYQVKSGKLVRVNGVVGGA